jgi:hypothetical protein
MNSDPGRIDLASALGEFVPSQEPMKHGPIITDGLKPGSSEFG